MSATSEPPPTLVLDANVIIDLVKLDIFAAVLGLGCYTFAVVQEVIGEVRRSEQARVLGGALEAGLLQGVTLESHDEVVAFAQLAGVVGRGEAASVAFAASHGCHFATDERQPRLLREIRSRLGDHRLVRGAALVANATDAGAIDLERLTERVRVLVTTAAGPLDRDESEHLSRVLERVRERLRPGGQA